MRYRNLTRERLAKTREETITYDGIWPVWPKPSQHKKTKKLKVARTASYKVARALKPGSGRLS